MINKQITRICLSLFSLLLCSSAMSQETSMAPVDATVYIVSPSNGDVVSNQVKVVFGLSGMGVAPAGANIPNTGHHHLIVDAPLPDTGIPVPSDDNHLHFGKGQTEAIIELAPGKHTLQLLLGDWLHKPHDNPVSSEQITITVN